MWLLLFEWDQKDRRNELLRDLKATGFEIVYEEGTTVKDEVTDVFQYAIGRKS